MGCQKNYREIKAIDTETVLGDIVIFATSDGVILQRPSFEEMLYVLTPKTSVRWFCYNSDFDVGGILKMLPQEQLTEYVVEGAVDYKTFHIEKRGRSSFVIYRKEGGRIGRKHAIYDLAQFYAYGRLGDMAKQWLKDEKMDTPIIEEFKTKTNTIEFYELHKELLSEYCLHDAILTKDLARLFEKKCDENKYDFSNPISYGTLTTNYYKPFITIPGEPKKQIPRIKEQVITKECIAKIGLKPQECLDYIEEMFSQLSNGGWNETFMKGKFDDVYDYDVKGCYTQSGDKAPYWAGTWNVAYTEKDVPAETAYGLVECDIKNLKYPIIPLRMPSLVTEHIGDKELRFKQNVTLNCIGDIEHYTLSYQKYLTIKKFADVTFHYAIYLVPDFEGLYPMVEANRVIIQRKKDAEETLGKNSLERHIHKYILNPITGKLKQKFHSNYTWFFYPHVYDFITWNCRCLVLDMINDNNLWDDVISVSTDGFATTKRIDYDKKKWEEIHAMPWVQVANGIYYYYDEKGNYIQRGRGFNISDRPNTDRTQLKIDLERLFSVNPEKSIHELHNKRFLHVKECIKLRNVYSPSQMGQQVTVTKHLNFNKEIKRAWGDVFNSFNEILSGKILKSTAHTFEEGEKIIAYAGNEVELAKIEDFLK